MHLNTQGATDKENLDTMARKAGSSAKLLGYRPNERCHLQGVNNFGLYLVTAFVTMVLLWQYHDDTQQHTRKLLVQPEASMETTATNATTYSLGGFSREESWWSKPELTFTPEKHEAPPGTTTPIFVLGAMKAGSSAICEYLAKHPMVHAGLQIQGEPKHFAKVHCNLSERILERLC